MPGAWTRSKDRKTVVRQWLALSIGVYAALVLLWPRLAGWPEGALADALAVATARAAAAAGWTSGSVQFSGQPVPVYVLAQLAREHPKAAEVRRARLITIWFPLFSLSSSAAALSFIATWRRRRQRGRVVRGSRVDG